MSAAPQESARQKLPWFWIVPIPVALAVGIIIGIQIPAPGSATPPVAAPTQGVEGADPVRPSIDVARLEAKDPAAIGVIGAPAVMVVYSDFQCSYCGKWAGEALPTLISDYVDAGKLRIEYRDVAFFGDTSRTAAVLAQAAGMQGRYQEFHDELFSGGQTAKNADLTEPGVMEIAGRIGADGKKLIADAESAAVAAVVQKNVEEASRIGVTGTPTFVINGQPLEAFVQVLDPILATG